MILKETILSMFTEKATLLKWLKKVEAALNNAVLSDISVVQVSETEVKLKFTFEDGEYVESPVLTLPRGEKGEKGEDGKDGLDGEGIAATIQVGTVTTGAAGTAASVTNVGTEQRAVFDFVIPRGEDGGEGAAGVGFDDATLIESNTDPDVVLGTAGFTIEGYMKVTAGDEVFEIPSTMIMPLASGEGIVIDVNEGGTGIEIHLDADVTMKLAKVLTTPTVAPASVSLVAIDANGAQTLIAIGDGLEIVDGVLKIKEDEPLGTWKFNNYFPINNDASQIDYAVNFVSNGAQFSKISSVVSGSEYNRIYNLYYDESSVYECIYSEAEETWSNNAYQTIEISSKLSEITNGDAFLTWLKANATKQ